MVVMDLRCRRNSKGLRDRIGGKNGERLLLGDMLLEAMLELFGLLGGWIKLILGNRYVISFTFRSG